MLLCPLWVCGFTAISRKAASKDSCPSRKAASKESRPSAHHQGDDRSADLDRLCWPSSPSPAGLGGRTWYFRIRQSAPPNTMGHLRSALILTARVASGLPCAVPRRFGLPMLSLVPDLARNSPRGGPHPHCRTGI